MMEFERLKRRNQEYLLIETIKRVGPSNYSLLARLTGLNPETVRYKISKQLPKYGLGLTVNINYGELGFSMGLLKIKASSMSGKSWFDHTHYLMLLSKVVGTDQFLCLYGIPFRFKKKYAESFEELKEKKLIEAYEMMELYWMRYPPFRSELYNFETKCWNVDWKRIESTTQEAGVTSFAVNHDPKVDDVDIKILKYLKEDPTFGLAKVGKEIGVNPRTVRYHHAEHVVKGNLIVGNNVRWTWPLQQGKSGEVMQVMAGFKGLNPDEVTAVRKLFNKLPFTWVEGGTEGKDYFAFLDIPILSFHECVRFIETSLGAARSKLDVAILDSAKTQYMNVPDEMFDKRLGWRLFGMDGDAPAASTSGSSEPRESRQVSEGERGSRT
ncbi:MAG TPA: AsnC family protein [Nitrososphaerales archaeon]|nr:AsnC family protein [Nitrososphaerales archaeon]